MFVAVETRNLQPCPAGSSANYLLISDIDLFYDVIYLAGGESGGEGRSLLKSLDMESV